MQNEPYSKDEMLQWSDTEIRHLQKKGKLSFTNAALLKLAQTNKQGFQAPHVPREITDWDDYQNE